MCPWTITTVWLQLQKVFCKWFVSVMFHIYKKSISYILHYAWLTKQTACKLVLQVRSAIISNTIKSLSTANFLL